MTNAQLNRLCKEWQKRLRISDWRVKCEFVGLLDDDADITMDRDRREACVRIAKTPSRSPLRACSPEEYLVHELVHIPIDPFNKTEDGSTEREELEFFINSIAEALVQMKYAKPAKA